jgi:hypothetical protein
VWAADEAARVYGFPALRVAAWSLGLALLVEIMCLTVQAIRPLPAVAVPAVAIAPAEELGGAAKPLDGMPSLAESASRRLFSTPAAAATSSSAPAPSESAKLLASRLTLMGIVSGDPAQAIIEDAQTKKTFFVTTGQTVIEGAVLEQVLDNRVILDLGGEKIELTL